MRAKKRFQGLVKKLTVCHAFWKKFSGGAGGCSFPTNLDV